MRTCSNCKRNLLTSDFYKQADGKDGLTSECKDCRKESVKAWKKENPDQVRASIKCYDLTYPQKKALRNQRFREKNPDYMKIYRERKRKESPS
jgi:hypothetical protein